MMLVMVMDSLHEEHKEKVRLDDQISLKVGLLKIIHGKVGLIYILTDVIQNIVTFCR